MRVILTGGCTGGHIYPALAIGDKFREMDPDCEIIYIAHQYGLETTIVPNAGYDLKIITAEWLRRDNPIKMFKTARGALKGRREALKIMRQFKPDVVVSTGSFVSVPVVLAAHAYGAPIYMQEQNGFPGVSNRMFLRFAKKLFMGFASVAQYFDDKSKLVYSGNPVRAEFYGRDKTEDRKALELPADDFVITVFGGSLGSDTTNEIGKTLIRHYGGHEGVTIVFGTGRNHFENVKKQLEADNLTDFDNARVMPYISDMPSVMSASDLIISRAGALSVAEVTMTGTAAVFVPSPNVTADHQYYNAKAVADQGGAIIVRENESTSDEVMREVEKLESDRDLLHQMEANSLALAPTEATNIIYNTIMETYK